MKITRGKKYRLGLDLGTNSIGWAAVHLDDQGQPYGVLDMGVRIFPDGRNPTDKTSNAVARRIARGQRRRRDRYLMRRDKLMQALIEYGLMPPDTEARKELQRLDPYCLRARALDQPLSPFELGRALFHLDQRRGFKSNRKSGGEEEEEKKTGAAIEELRRSIEESGARTLGEFLAWRHAQRETVRAREESGGGGMACGDGCEDGPRPRGVRAIPGPGHVPRGVRQNSAETGGTSQPVSRAMGQAATHHLPPAASATGGTGLVPI